MSEHMFGLGRGFLTDDVIRVAEEAGATAVNYDDPSQGQRHWFCVPNLGSPFDKAAEKEMWTALEAAGLVGADGKPRTVRDDDEA